MRIEEIEKFFEDNQYHDLFELAQRVNDKRRQQALRNSENLVKRDQLVCDIMNAWTKVTDLTKYSVQVQVTPEAKKALMIARTALELALEDIQRHAFIIKRV